MSFVQTVYLFPSKVPITIQPSERSVRATAFKDICEITLQKTRSWSESIKSICLTVRINNCKSDDRCSVHHLRCNIYSLYTISEEVRFVRMHNDNIKEVSPVFSNHVCHSFIPAFRKGKKTQVATGHLAFVMCQHGLI